MVRLFHADGMSLIATFEHYWGVEVTGFCGFEGDAVNGEARLGAEDRIRLQVKSRVRFEQHPFWLLLRSMRGVRDHTFRNLN